MNSEDIKKWRDRYNECERDEDRENEARLTERIKKNQKITINELKDIVKWKFNGSEYLEKVVQKGIIKTIEDNNSAEYVEKQSEIALKCTTDKEKLKKLMKIKGVGPAVASTILTFSNPEQYGIFDIHAFREMFGGVDIKLYPILKYFEQIRGISKETEFSGRDIDKAYFQKNYEKGKR